MGQEASRGQRPDQPHSPAVCRIDGVVANMPEFAAAFSCKPSAPLVKQKV